MSDYPDGEYKHCWCLGITTIIGCPLGCKKMCAQEVFVKRYVGKNRLLTPANFKIILDHTPKEVPISFGGFSEPFKNPCMMELIEMAKNHPLLISTTLHGVTMKQAEQLLKYDWKDFRVHLPDKENLIFPITQEYKDVFFELRTKLDYSRDMNMNKTFSSVKRENVLRGEPVEYRKLFGVCSHMDFDFPDLQVLPNGDVHSCCFDMGLTQKVGNLLTEDYEAIRKKRKQLGMFDLCHYCCWNNHASIKGIFYYKYVTAYLQKLTAYLQKLINH